MAILGFTMLSTKEAQYDKATIKIETATNKVMDSSPNTSGIA